MPFGARYVHIIATCPPLAEGWGQAWGRGGSDRNDNLSFLSTRGALLLLFFFLRGALLLLILLLFLSIVGSVERRFVKKTNLIQVMRRAAFVR